MHYYKFNIGDYHKSTAHLDIIEDCIYRRLIDYYFDTESPIPLDIDIICRKLRIKDKKTETQAILSEFFNETKKGWIHKRIQSELNDYSSKAIAARANGKKGGRPKITQPVNLANPALTQPKAKQEPLTTNHKPLNKEITEVATLPVFNFKSELIKLGVQEPHLSDWLKVRAKKKASNTQTSLTGIVNQVALTNKSVNEIIKVCAESSWSGFKASWLQKEESKDNQTFQERHTDDTWKAGL